MNLLWSSERGAANAADDATQPVIAMANNFFMRNERLCRIIDWRPSQIHSRPCSPAPDVADSLVGHRSVDIGVTSPRSRATTHSSFHPAWSGYTLHMK